uniref:Uncharacterized protein n=1 Tax=Candidatus Kentrum sp. TC TaxID=2126339 RepID=A0A450YRE3_9GAMM|nr:MAG: hypothetical protein BECKTC1821E_GA0114239_103110 [Candidatus Kentron sp. TC]
MRPHYRLAILSEQISAKHTRTAYSRNAYFSEGAGESPSPPHEAAKANPFRQSSFHFLLFRGDGISLHER